MLLRLATLTDIPQIMQLITDVVPIMNAAGNFQWDSTYPNPQVFENDITLNQLWVAEIDGHIAGITAITTDQEPEYAEVGWDIGQTAIVTHRLAVSPRFQGKGVAAALLVQAEVVGINQKAFPKAGLQICRRNRPGLQAGDAVFVLREEAVVSS
jgi:GNAT superfamily N-acetyltransferase